MKVECLSAEGASSSKGSLHPTAAACGNTQNCWAAPAHFSIFYLGRNQNGNTAKFERELQGKVPRRLSSPKLQIWFFGEAFKGSVGKSPVFEIFGVSGISVSVSRLAFGQSELLSGNRELNHDFIIWKGPRIDSCGAASHTTKAVLRKSFLCCLV